MVVQAYDAAGNSSDAWADFHAQVMDVERLSSLSNAHIRKERGKNPISKLTGLAQQNDLTTYSVGCATDPCAGWGNLPTFTYTVAIAQTTFDMLYSDYDLLSTHTACTFFTDAASPSAFPTSASCEMTNRGTIRTSTMGYEHHFTVPDETGLWNVLRATLRVVDGTVATPTGTGASAGVTGTAGGVSSTGPGITTGPTATPTGSGGSVASATTSLGWAMKTRAGEAWALGIACAAGALLLRAQKVTIKDGVLGGHSRDSSGLQAGMTRETLLFPRPCSSTQYV